MRSYLESRLEKRNLLTILARCKKAAKSGYLENGADERRLMEKALKIHGFERFTRERKKAYQDYSRFCWSLEKILPKIEKIKAPKERLRQLLPLFQEALILDSKRRVFDIIYKYPGNILDYLTEKTRKRILVMVSRQLQDRQNKKQETQKKTDEILYSLIDACPYVPYAVAEIKDFVNALKCLGQNGVREIPDSVEKLRETMKKVDPSCRQKIKKLVSKYACSSEKNLAVRMRFYKDLWGKEDEILKRLKIRAKQKNKQRKQILKKSTCHLQPKEKKTLEKLLNQLYALIMFNSYEDPLLSNTVNGIQDYFLRENLAQALYELGIIKSSVPTKYPQRFLLDKAQKAFKDP